jgi:LmbE family N-acetylglucosaminyl deacetylase
VHHATLQAFELARDPDFEDGLPAHQVQKMYFHVMPRGRLRFWMGVMRLTGRDPRKFGRNGDIDLVSLVDEGDFPTHASIDISPVRERKDAAAACHASQLDGGMPRRGLLSCILRWYTRRERFMRAYPPAEGGKLERDLFAGIALDWSRNSTVHKNG